MSPLVDLGPWDELAQFVRKSELDSTHDSSQNKHEPGWSLSPPFTENDEEFLNTDVH